MSTRAYFHGILDFCNVATWWMENDKLAACTLLRSCNMSLDSGLYVVAGSAVRFDKMEIETFKNC